MTDEGAAARRLTRSRTWTSTVIRDGDVHRQMAELDAAEWAALSPAERLTLAWELSLQQEGLDDDGPLPPPDFLDLLIELNAAEARFLLGSRGE